MTKAIGHYLMLQLKEIPYLDRVAGLVQTVERAEESGSVYKLPASDDVWERSTDCIQEICATDMIPDSQLRGIAYIEDMGTRDAVVNKARGRMEATTKLRIVCWLNVPNSNNPRWMIPSLASADIVAAISRMSGSYPPLYITSLAVDQVLNGDASLFSKYSYREADIQYLLCPYQALAVDISVNWLQMLDCTPLTFGL